MNELMTWASLATMAGAVAATLLIVQYVKPLIQAIDTRLLALGVALIILLAATAISGGSVEAYGLAVINAFIVASAAMGAYQVTFQQSDVAKKLAANGQARPN